MGDFKSCPVCREQSDQCLSCASYVVEGERIYYEKLKDFGATKDHEVRFINRIQKHCTTAFFHNGELYIPSRQGRSVPLAIGLQWNAWQEQQAIINDLKAQLENMEACYIEKKKQVEDALSRIEGLMVHAVADYENTKSTSMMCAVQGVEKALGSKSNVFTDTRQKVEDQINNGARLTKHQIDLRGEHE